MVKYLFVGSFCMFGIALYAMDYTQKYHTTSSTSGAVQQSNLELNEIKLHECHLRYAALMGNMSQVFVLLEQGADSNEADEMGTTPLYIVARLHNNNLANNRISKAKAASSVSKNF
jgi:ankyrin repeat protein